MIHNIFNDIFLLYNHHFQILTVLSLLPVTSNPYSLSINVISQIQSLWSILYSLLISNEGINLFYYTWLAYWLLFSYYLILILLLNFIILDCIHVTTLHLDKSSLNIKISIWLAYYCSLSFSFKCSFPLFSTIIQ